MTSKNYRTKGCYTMNNTKKQADCMNDGKCWTNGSCQPCTSTGQTVQPS